MGLIWMVVVGLIAGLIARAIMPGKDAMGWVMTIVLGIVGSFVGGFLINLVMHNDAVVQGLSEVPFMREVKRWGVLTIGTGLGNARFTNRRKDNGEKSGGKGKKDRNEKDRDK